MEKLLCFGTQNRVSSNDGVVVVGSSACWFDLAKGLIICKDIFSAGKVLRFVHLPPVSTKLDNSSTYQSIHGSRCVQVSKDKIRFLHLGGEGTLELWTLMEGADGEHQWLPEPQYPVQLAEFLPTAGPVVPELPKLALIDPQNPNIVFIWQGTRLLSVEACAGSLTYCGEPLLGQDLDLLKAPLLAWRLPPSLNRKLHRSGWLGFAASILTELCQPLEDLDEEEDAENRRLLLQGISLRF